MQETVVWKGSQSQAVNFGSYLFWGIFFWTLIPLLIIGWKWLVSKNTLYEVTNERITVKSGVFNLVTDECELYRIRDYSLYQPFFLRIFGVSTIVLETSDRTNPIVILEGVADGKALLSQIRNLVEDCRKNKGVRDLDI